MVKPTDQQIAYFPQAVWSDKLPRLVRARLVEVFENAKAFDGVGTGRDRIQADLVLVVDIRAFQVEIDGGQAVAHVDVFCKLVDESNGPPSRAKSVQCSSSRRHRRRGPRCRRAQRSLPHRRLQHVALDGIAAAARAHRACRE